MATLAATKLPTLIVAGEDDVLVPLDGARRMHEAAPHARLEVIPGAVHMSPLEQPKRFLDVVRAFLKETRPGDGGL